MGIIKSFMNNIFTLVSFFVLFSSHTFRGLAGACVNPGRFSLLVHSLVCPITHSFLDGFQLSTFPKYALLDYFQPKEST